MTAMFGFWALALVVFATIGYLSWSRSKKRALALAAWATNSGYSYVARDDSWCTRWGHQPFGQGSGRSARNVVTGKIGDRSFVAFDYSYVVSDGKNTTRYYFAVTAIALPLPLPQLQVTGENVLTRIGDAILGDDIDLESDEFNRRFRVTCTDRKFAYDVLTPRTMQALLAAPPLEWRLAGTDALGWTRGNLTPVIAMQHLQTLRMVVDGIPEFVWHEQA